MSNYPDGMRTSDWDYVDGYHCPMCEDEDCGDDDAHATCSEHTMTRGEYLADQAGF